MFVNDEMLRNALKAHKEPPKPARETSGGACDVNSREPVKEAKENITDE